MWFILVNLPQALEEYVYFGVVVWSITYMSVRTFVVHIFAILLISCPVVLSVAEYIWKSPTVIVYLSISLFGSINFCFTYLKFCCLVCTHLGLLCFSGAWIVLSFCNVPLVIFFALKFTLLDGNIVSSDF